MRALENIHIFFVIIHIVDKIDQVEGLERDVRDVGAGHSSEINKKRIAGRAERTNPGEASVGGRTNIDCVPGALFDGVDSHLDVLISAPQILVSNISKVELLLPAD